MKKIALISFIILFCTSSAFSMDTLDFSDYDSIDQIKPQYEDLNRSVYAGMNTLTWTSADAPTILGFNINLVTGFGGFDANPEIGIEDDGFLPSTAAFQVGVGTAGLEVYGRVMPEVELGSDIKAQTLGVGVKYELTDLLDIPGFPDIALFGEYNTFGLKQNEDVDTEFGTIDSGIDLKFKSTNFGILVSKSFAIVGVYGKAGVQSGTTDMQWNQVLEDGMTNKITGDFSDSQFAYAVGLSLVGIKAEVGARGSNLSFGLGWGIEF